MPLTNYAFADLITFTRSTTATFVGSNGLIQSAAINAPRFDFDPVTLAPLGILIEEQRVNSALYSEQFDDAYWNANGGTVSANNAISPDGTSNADTFTEALGLTDPRFPVTVTLSIGFSYTLSTYVKIKAGSAQRYLMLVFNAGFAAVSGANFDLVAGVVGATSNATGTITPAGNGWFRCTMTPSATATATSASFRVRIASVDTSVNIAGPTAYIGDGASGFIYYGAQLEAGTFATSYIPTVASTVTRAPDNAAITGANFPPWYNYNEGSIVVSGDSFRGAAGSARNFQFDDGTPANNIRAAGQSVLQVVDASVVQASLGPTPLIPFDGTVYKFASAYRLNDFASVTTGAVATDTSGTVPIATTQLVLGAGAGANYLNGHLRNITYYPTRLTDAQLQALTA